MPDALNTKSVDVAATIAALREQAIARAKAMGLTEQAAIDDPLRQAADLAHISAHFPIMWRVPIAGRGLSLVKRVMRIGLRWYINPIVDQINDFNEATITALNTLAARQEALAARIAAVEGAGYGSPDSPPAQRAPGFPTGEGGENGAVSADARRSESPLSRSAAERPGEGASA